MNRSSAWIITRILGFLAMVPVYVISAFLVAAICFSICVVGLYGYGIVLNEANAHTYFEPIFAIAAVIGVYASARIAFLGLWRVPQFLEAMEGRFFLFARWMLQVAGYMLLAYFVIMFLTLIKDYNPEASREEFSAAFDAARGEKKHLFLIALAASAFVAWLDVRLKKKEG